MGGLSSSGKGEGACHGRLSTCGCLLPLLACWLLRLLRPFLDGRKLWAATVDDRFTSRLRQGSSPVVVVVGTNDLSDDMQDEISFYDKYSARFILVEANPNMISPLRSRLQAINVDEARVLVVSAALAANASGAVTFYCVDPRLYDDLPERYRDQTWADWTRINSRCCSLSYNDVQRGTAGQWWLEPYFRELPRPIESYITAPSVQAMTPGELLAHAGVGPADVDVLSIDAEGESVGLLNAFLELDGAAPAFGSVETHFAPLAGPAWDRFWGLRGADYCLVERWTHVDAAFLRRPPGALGGALSYLGCH